MTMLGYRFHVLIRRGDSARLKSSHPLVSLRRGAWQTSLISSSFGAINPRAKQSYLQPGVRGRRHRKNTDRFTRGGRQAPVNKLSPCKRFSKHAFDLPVITTSESRAIFMQLKIWQLHLKKKPTTTDNQLLFANKMLIFSALPLPLTLKKEVERLRFHLARDALDQLYVTEAYNVAPHWFRCNKDTSRDRPWALYVVQERRPLWWWGKIWFLSKVPLSWEQNLLSSLIRIISICVSVISVIDAFLVFLKAKQTDRISCVWSKIHFDIYTQICADFILYGNILIGWLIDWFLL